jgi:hypothetical protein
MVDVSKDSNNYQHLMRINVGDQLLRNKGKLLLIGSCMDRYPNIVQEFSEKKEDFVVLQVCLEETHVNQAGFKIGSIIKYAGITDVTALTVDGSPHCIQLHYVIEDIKRHFAPEITTAHYVVEKGIVHEVSAEAVKRSRHLSRIHKMLK